MALGITNLLLCVIEPASGQSLAPPPSSLSLLKLVIEEKEVNEDSVSFFFFSPAESIKTLGA